MNRILSILLLFGASVLAPVISAPSKAPSAVTKKPMGAPITIRPNSAPLCIACNATKKCPPNYVCSSNVCHQQVVGGKPCGGNVLCANVCKATFKCKLNAFPDTGGKCVKVTPTKPPTKAPVMKKPTISSCMSCSAKKPCATGYVCSGANFCQKEVGIGFQCGGNTVCPHVCQSGLLCNFTLGGDGPGKCFKPKPVTHAPTVRSSSCHKQVGRGAHCGGPIVCANVCQSGLTCKLNVFPDSGGTCV